MEGGKCVGDSIQFDEQMKGFFETIGTDVQTLEEREICIKKGLEIIAESMRLGKAELSLELPKNRLIPDGEHCNSVLYDSEKAGKGLENEYGKPLEMEININTGGRVVITDHPLGSDYTDEEAQIHSFIFKEIFYQYNRTMAQWMIDQVMNTDINTGVANQDALMYYVVRLMKTGQLDGYTGIFYNIHNFKYVNMVFAYSQGDVILRNYSQKIKSYLQPDEIIARLGGDNFVVVIKNENADEFIRKIRDVRISHEWKSMKREFQLGATVGVARLDKITVPKDVMARTSIAYQVARRRGAGSMVMFTQEIQKHLMDDQEILSAFPQALANGEFTVYYQPKVNISDRTLYGAEALVRWFRQGELVLPMRFISQLEREGSVCMLDYYVLEQTCRFLKSRQDKGQNIVPISVNFSRRHLEEDDLVDRIVEVVDRYGIDHSYIEIELTESEDYQNYEIMSNVINRLKERGISTSIDDFGTGFSSLNMIKEVDLDTIKIDKSLIPLDNGNDSKEQDIVMFSSIVSLINKLGKKSVAEGVETEVQLDYLKKLGCDIVQGYVFDRPLTCKDFEERLENGYK